MRLFKTLTSITALSIASANVFAEAGVLEEVIVTATKRAESLQNIAVTVTAFGAEAIQDAEIHNAMDLSVLTPSLSITVNTNPFNARMNIRGIGTAQNDPALEPSVGLFVDGVFLGRTGLGMSDLVDIERIEVLQGPQGTLYGKNTNAGAISVITKKPNMEDFEAHISATAGDYSLQRFQGSVSGPISNSTAFRLTGSLHKRDGYYDNSGGDDLNDVDDWNLRGKLLWTPTDTMEVLFTAAHVERDTTCCAADSIQNDSVNQELANQNLQQDKNDPYDFEVGVSVDSRFDLESDLLSLNINYDLDSGSLVSITSWNDYDYSTSQDADRSELDVFNIVNDGLSGDSFSQELRFSSSFGEAIDYQVGLFYYDQTTKQGGETPFAFLGEDFLTIAGQQPLGLPVPLEFVAQPGDSVRFDHKLKTETIAVFSQATWHIGETWHLKAGLRWNDEEKDADLFTEIQSTAPLFLATGQALLNGVTTPIDANLDRTSDDVNWLLSLSKDAGEDTMLFATVATGSKSGGFNTVSGQPEDREFDDEDTTNYEVGVKSTLLDSRLRINATAFYTEIDDYQSQQQLESGAGTFVSNFGAIETSGMDVHLDALPLPNLSLTIGLLYMHKYEITDGPNDGLELPFTGEYSGNISATYVLPVAKGNAFLRADYSYMDDHSTNSASSDELRSTDFDDREQLNLKLGWRNDQWDFSVWGKNLTDDEYASRTTVRFPFSGMDAFFLAPPRTYGVTLRYDI